MKLSKQELEAIKFCLHNTYVRVTDKQYDLIVQLRYKFIDEIVKKEIKCR